MSHTGVGRLPLIQAALERRLGEVRKLLTGEPESAPATLPLTQAQSEEKLHHLMVRAWPGRAGHRAGSEEWDAFLTELLGLERVATGADLRFLDAWNNAYEAIKENSSSDAMSRAPVIRFLLAYERILRIQRDRLSEESARHDRSRG